MLITRDSNHGDFQIQSYQPGTIKINDLYYEESILVSGNRLERWAPQRIEEVTQDMLSVVMTYKPDMVLLGTGEELVFPSPAVLQVCYDERIGIEVMTTYAACRTFNVLMSESRNVVAALIIR